MFCKTVYNYAFSTYKNMSTFLAPSVTSHVSSSLNAYECMQFGKPPKGKCWQTSSDHNYELTKYACEKGCSSKIKAQDYYNNLQAQRKVISDIPDTGNVYEIHIKRGTINEIMHVSICCISSGNGCHGYTIKTKFPTASSFAVQASINIYDIDDMHEVIVDREGFFYNYNTTKQENYVFEKDVYFFLMESISLIFCKPHDELRITLEDRLNTKQMLRYGEYEVYCNFSSVWMKALRGYTYYENRGYVPALTFELRAEEYMQYKKALDVYFYKEMTLKEIQEKLLPVINTNAFSEQFLEIFGNKNLRNRTKAFLLDAKRAFDDAFQSFSNHLQHNNTTYVKTVQNVTPRNIKHMVYFDDLKIVPMDKFLFFTSANVMRNGSLQKAKSLYFQDAQVFQEFCFIFKTFILFPELTDISMKFKYGELLNTEHDVFETLSTIKTLESIEINLAGFDIPYWIFNLTQLKCLSIHSKTIKEIPEWFKEYLNDANEFSFKLNASSFNAGVLEYVSSFNKESRLLHRNVFIEL